MKKTQKIWGINFLNGTMDDYVSYLQKVIGEREKIILTGINPYSLSIIKRNPVMLDALRATTIANVDGILLKYTLQILGYAVPERLDTPSVFVELMKLCAKEKFRIFLLGSKSEDLPSISEELHRKFPGVFIAGTHHGFFAREDEEAVVKLIDQSKPDVLIFGMPSPKKEVFIYEHCAKIDFKVSLGVGGVFDLLAGKKKPAPSMVKRMNIEWLYRFIQEPKRLFVRYKDMMIYYSWFVLNHRSKNHLF